MAYLSVFPFTLEYAICGLSVESIFIAENHPNFDPESIVWLCQPVLFLNAYLMLLTPSPE